MKSLLILILASLPLTAMAKGEQSSGCGLGWQVTKAMNTSASATRNTTHAVSSNTFAMTSGTSGCAQHSIVKLEKSKIHFMEANLIPLRYEAAVGMGERMSAMAGIFGCLNSEVFNSKIKENYVQIFSNDSAQSVLREVENLILSHRELSSNCSV